MVTGIYEKRLRRLFIKDWQEHWQLSAEVMASRLGIERESYYRLLREPHRLNTDKLAQLADAMGHHMEPQDFYRPPTRPSVDAMLEDVPEAVRETAVDIVRRLVGKAS
jgi:hypothetical protein